MSIASNRYGYVCGTSTLSSAQNSTDITALLLLCCMCFTEPEIYCDVAIANVSRSHDWLTCYRRWVVISKQTDIRCYFTLNAALAPSTTKLKMTAIEPVWLYCLDKPDKLASHAN